MYDPQNCPDRFFQNFIFTFPRFYDNIKYKKNLQNFFFSRAEVTGTWQTAQQPATRSVWALQVSFFFLFISVRVATFMKVVVA
jgi:hypothetical protein